MKSVIVSDTLKQSQQLNHAFDDAFCLVVYEIAKGQRDEPSKGMREVAQKMVETVERETGYIPDVIMLLEVYCGFHPDVPYAVARENVLKATESVSNGGLNPITDTLSREDARKQAGAVVFGDEFKQFGDFSAISFQWLWMRFIAEHPEATGLDEKTAGGLFARWMDKRFAAAGHDPVLQVPEESVERDGATDDEAGNRGFGTSHAQGA